jgi:hypothetical protein
MHSSRLFLVTLGALTLGVSVPESVLPPVKAMPGAPSPQVER